MPVNNNNDDDDGNDRLSKRRKSQKEILAEAIAENPDPNDKWGPLLLTYQVPNMTQHYETLSRYFNNSHNYWDWEMSKIIYMKLKHFMI